jgi:hypothetical protein
MGPVNPPVMLPSRAKDDRDLLHVLRTELEFLHAGGYRRVARAPWRAAFYFEDSPTCPKLVRFSPGVQPCRGCVLFQLVPGDAKTEPMPCRHIPMDEQGDTLDSMYRWATPLELRAVFEGWLQRMIARLERERPASTGFDHLQLMA